MSWKTSGTCGDSKPVLSKRLGPFNVMPMAGRRVLSDPATQSRFTSATLRTRSISSYSSLRQEDSQFKANRIDAKPVVDDLVTGSGASAGRSGAATPALTADSDCCSGSGCSSSGAGDISDTDSVGPLTTTRRWTYKNRKARAKSIAGHPLLLPSKAMQDKVSAKKNYPSVLLDIRTTEEPALVDVHPDRANVERSKDANGDAKPTIDGLTPLNTAYLVPRTHKLTHGNVTILPSKCLLVDFRESERRKGRKGDEVLLISPDGLLVSSMPTLWGTP